MYKEALFINLNHLALLFSQCVVQNFIAASMHENKGKKSKKLIIKDSILGI